MVQEIYKRPSSVYNFDGESPESNSREGRSDYDFSHLHWRVTDAMGGVSGEFNSSTRTGSGEFNSRKKGGNQKPNQVQSMQRGRDAGVSVGGKASQTHATAHIHMQPQAEQEARNQLPPISQALKIFWELLEKMRSFSKGFGSITEIKWV